MGSSSPDPFDSSINGDRRKERYGVINDCAAKNANVSHIFHWTDDGMRHLEVIQEAHIGIAERDLPLRA